VARMLGHAGLEMIFKHYGKYIRTGSGRTVEGFSRDSRRRMSVIVGPSTKNREADDRESGAPAGHGRRGGPPIGSTPTRL